MKTPEDEAFDDLARKQGAWGGGFPAKRRMAADKLQEPVKLWLWKNFVDGKPEYWAFDNPFPCITAGGDPLTLGEPCGWALFKTSVNGRPNSSEQEVVDAVMRLSPLPVQPAPEPYDQTALELCNVCGWKTLIPDDGCLNCERKAQPAQRPWVGLTDEERVAVLLDKDGKVLDYEDCVRAIEQLLKEKSNG